MMVNPDVDGYTTTLNNRKMLRKTQKNNNLPKTKIILHSSNKLRAGRVLHSACPWGRFASLPPVSYTTECEGVSVTNVHE